MTRAWFGGGVADFVVTAPAPGDPLRFAAATLTMWDAETGGTQVPDLLLGGVPVTSIPVGTNGAVPSFQGPDGVYALWAQAGASGERSRLDAVGSIVEAAGGVTDGLMTAVASDPGSDFSAQQKASYGAGKYGAETRAPAAFPKAFIANGEGNIVQAIVDRALSPTRAHVEGYGCAVYEQSTHAEGTGTLADGKIAHAEGNNSICTANDSHAEGNESIAGRRWYTDVTTGTPVALPTGSEDAGGGLGVLQYVIVPDAEGDVTSAFPNPLTDNVATRYGAGFQKDIKGCIYAAGDTPATYDASGNLLAANSLTWAMHPVAIVRGMTDEGEKAFITIAKAVYTPGSGTKVYYLGAKPFTSIKGIASSYGPQVWFGGQGQHAEGFYSSTSGRGAHSEGLWTRAWHHGAHAEGYRSRATGQYSHAEGEQTKASGASSHTEGYATQASGLQAHAEGWSSIASGDFAHAEGDSTTASGAKAHAEGESTVAAGFASHSEGRLTVASGLASHAGGFYANASRDYQEAYAGGRRSATGDAQTSRISYTSSRADAGWHAIDALRQLENSRTYHFETLVMGRQTAGSAGTVGDSFAYKFSGVFVMDGTGVMTVLGTITRTLIGRSVGMAGDGLTTGVRLSEYTSAYPGFGGTNDLVLRMDGLLNTTFQVLTTTTWQELA